MFWGSMAILAGMTLLGLYVGLSRPERRPAAPSRLLILGGGLALPLVVIAALLAYGIQSGQPLVAVQSEERLFRVHVIGHQWWWEVRYPDHPAGTLHDANEIHVPAGQPVDIRVTAGDVIHSFWVPRLAGKIDAIPGQVNRIRLKASAPGVYRGVCAEFCGAQHARMHLVLEAHEADALEERLETLSERSRTAAELAEHPGGAAFIRHCAQCHSIDPRHADPVTGPNLAGVPDRRHLGAGTLRHQPGAIQTWIREHHELKPGNRMALFEDLDDATVEALADFLEQPE